MFVLAEREEKILGDGRMFVMYWAGVVFTACFTFEEFGFQYCRIRLLKVGCPCGGDDVR